MRTIKTFFLSFVLCAVGSVLGTESIGTAAYAGMPDRHPSEPGAERIKVACVGDSVTYGYGIEDRDNDSYPAQLQKLLGAGYEVRNFGHNGATLMNRGHRPYTGLPEFAQALDFKADLVVIHLGLNDTDPRNWPNWSEDFIPDYKALIDTFRAVNPESRIWICLMSPIMHGHPRFLSGTRDWHAQEQGAIRQVAATSGVGLIDLYSPLFVRPDLFADNLHPSPEGAGIIAGTVYGALTGDFGGLAVSGMYSDHMVVQRDRPIVFKGMADRGERVKVTFAGKRQTAVAGDDGKWMVEFAAMPAGGPYKLDISGKERSFHFSDVWLGEVWLCAGQSNMEFKLSGCSTAGEDLAAAPAQDKVHLFNFRENWLTGDVVWPESALDSVNRLQYLTPRGWERSSSESAARFSAVGYHFGRVLADSLGCHVGLISCAVGGSTTESWVDPEVLRWEYPQVLYNWSKGDFGQEWARGRAMRNIAAAKNPLQRHPYQPGYLFDAGIRQLDNFGLRGVLWYQGESNAHNMETHADFFRLMVKGFRKCFGPDLALQVVQLSGIGNRPSWPWFRDSQRRLAEEISNAGLTVCSDLGHPTDVHPRVKKPVGERSAVCVLHDVYGWSGIIPSGPVYKDFSVEGRCLRLRFDYGGEMSVSKGFEVAGKDGVYHPAMASVDGQTVLVWSEAVPEPCAVRYGWRPNPVEADLTNESGIPASTFRDERFPDCR